MTHLLLLAKIRLARSLQHHLCSAKMSARPQLGVRPLFSPLHGRGTVFSLCVCSRIFSLDCLHAVRSLRNHRAQQTERLLGGSAAPVLHLVERFVFFLCWRGPSSAAMANVYTDKRGFGFSGCRLVLHFRPPRRVRVSQSNRISDASIPPLVAAMIPTIGTICA